MARAAAAHARRFVELRRDHDGTVVIRGRLGAEDGALLVAALDATADLPAVAATAQAAATWIGPPFPWTQPGGCL